MIGFNGTYLHAASLGNMRITDAAIGGQLVIGGNWLIEATNIAIIAAFGAEEGAQVIRKTNDYLNAIAATDLQRAQQLAMFINEKPMFTKFLLDYNMQHFEPPRLAIDADDAKDERKWLIRAENNYTDWYLLDNVLSQTNFEYVLGGITPTSNYVSKVGNTKYTNGTIVKFFVPTTMPTGYSEWFADGMTIYINGQQVIHTTSYHNNRKDVTFDFSPYIKLNEMNYIILRWWGGGSHGFDWGFLG